MLFFRGDFSRCEDDNTSMNNGSLAPIDLDGGKHLPLDYSATEYLHSILH